MIIRDATTWDLLSLARNLRNTDLRELELTTGKAPLDALTEAFEMSTQCMVVTLTEGGEPAAIFGAAPQPDQEGTGIVWLMATPEIRKCALAFLKVVPEIIEEMLQEFPRGLHNIVWSKNRLHVRWIKAAGFTIGGTVAYQDEPFTYFHLRPTSKNNERGYSLV